MENKTPTPRTDEAEVIARKKYEAERECGWPEFDSSGYDFARTLELELNEAKKSEQCWIFNANELQKAFNIQEKQLTTAQQEITELRKQVDADKYNREMWARIITKWNSLCTENDELKRDKERLDWLENNGVEIGISALAYHEISATRLAIDKGMREIQTKDSAMKGANSK